MVFRFIRLSTIDKQRFRDKNRLYRMSRIKIGFDSAINWQPLCSTSTKTTFTSLYWELKSKLVRNISSFFTP